MTADLIEKFKALAARIGPQCDLQGSYVGQKILKIIEEHEAAQATEGQVPPDVCPEKIWVLVKGQSETGGASGIWNEHGATEPGYWRLYARWHEQPAQAEVQA